MPKQAIVLVLILFVAWPAHATFVDRDHSSKPLKVNKTLYKKSRGKARRAGASRVASSSPLTCMARNIYFEAGVESDKGKIAVANVTMNRVKSKHYPRSVCGVVFQKSKRSCAFSWTCDRKGNIPPNNTIYRKSEEIAKLALSGALRDITGRADHYHAEYVKPKWRKKDKKKAKIGRHVFYKLLDG